MDIAQCIVIKRYFLDSPDVVVNAKNTTTAAIVVELYCEAFGAPDNYTYISWEHTWPGNTSVLRSYPGSEVLRLEVLTYEHNGFYTCNVSNGVHASRNQGAGQGTTYLNIQGRIQIYPLTILIHVHTLATHVIMNVSFSLFIRAFCVKVTILRDTNFPLMNSPKIHVVLNARTNIIRAVWWFPWYCMRLGFHWHCYGTHCEQSRLPLAHYA